MTTPITTDLTVLRQSVNVDVESVAPTYGFSEDAYDVANSTITATVQTPPEGRYRLVLAGQIESGTSAMVRVVSGTDDHFKDVVSFKRITNGEAAIIKPVLDKLGVTLDSERNERDQLIEHAAQYKVAECLDPRRPAGPAHPREREAHASGGRPASLRVHHVRAAAVPCPCVERAARGDGRVPARLHGCDRRPKVEAMPNQVQPNLVAGGDALINVGAQQAYGWAFQADPKITMGYRYA